MLQMVPATATSVAAGGINLAKTVEEIRSIAGEIDPEVQTAFNQALGAVQLYTTVNLEKDLFASLGEHWVIYQDPQISGFGAVGVIAVNKLNDAAKAERALTSLTNAINNTLAGLLKKEEVEVSIRQIKVGDITVNYVAVPLISPAWAIKDGYLYVALYPQNALAAARAGKPKSSIFENAGYQALRKRLGVERPASMLYDDLPRALPSNYQSLLMISRTAFGMGDLFGIHAPELVLPPMEELAKHLAPAGSVGWADEQGFHAKSVYPFPGAALVSGPGAAMLVAGPAIGAGIAMPAVQKAQQNASRVKCASNMRQIAQAMLLYSNDNQGNYPPDLGTLVTTQDIEPIAFLCPDSNRKLPGNWGNMDNDKKLAWINANSDYVYVGAGKTNATPADEILVYEKDRNHKHQGMNMVFADGHVEWQSMEDAKERIAKQK
jgi:prepilin-type processing-associated H-X9-DG protein